ncbi:MAG TPA: helix-turn-helix domain-containing protein [Rhizomicrobium sp.]|nr:helix-turn-helix domain-containing protein [Rhizomicrobium sp.]
MPRAVEHDPPDNEAKRVKGDPLAIARFTWVQACAHEREITVLEMRLAVVLAHEYAGMPVSRKRFEDSGVPVAWPPQVMLAETLRCSRQAVSAAARRLEKRGFLVIIRPARWGRGHASEYQLIQKGKQPACLLEREKRQAAASETANHDPRKGKNRQRKRQAGCLPHSFHSNPNINPIHNPRREVGDFLAGVRGVRSENDSGWPKRRRDADGKYPELEEIIGIWPNKKIDEGKAKGAWINNVIREQLNPSRVLKRARAWCSYWEEERPKFIPYLGKWLAEAGWEEDPPETTFERNYRYETRMGLNKPRPHACDDPESPD